MGQKYAGLKVWELTSTQASKCPLKPRTLLRREADAILPILVSHLFGGLVGQLLAGICIKYQKCTDSFRGRRLASDSKSLKDYRK